MQEHLLSSKRKEYITFFQYGAGNTELSEDKVLFVYMTHHERKQYVERVLMKLLSEYPDDVDMKEFVRIGRLYLLGGSFQKASAYLQTEKVNLRITSILLVLFTLFAPNVFPSPQSFESTIGRIIRGDEE